ncbi:excalibur calcium-binding domain-containing protein [Belnapia arida]
MRIRRSWRRAKGYGLLAIVAAGALGYLVQLFIFSPWPLDLTFKHYQARHNCDAARAVGLAPARRGKPGYWSKLDADQDGISCEPWRPYYR